jgi:EH_Signature domain
MTGHLKSSVARVQEIGRFPKPPDRMLALEHSTRKLGNQVGGKERASEEWADFIARINLNALDTIRSGDFRHLLHDIWTDAALHDASAPVLEYAVAEGRKTYDRTIIMAYLRQFPVDHPIFNRLAAAAGLVSRRQDWPWHERGERWSLWDVEAGPQRLATGLMATDDNGQILRESGFDQLSDSRFLAVTLEAACMAASTKGSAEAKQAGTRLIALIGLLPGTGRLDGLLAYALLVPWVSTAPPDAYRQQLLRFLVGRIGDPRLQPLRWSAIRREALDRIPGADPDTVFTVLRRWLVQDTVRQFFDIVAKTTDDRVQWGARAKFWLAYLDAGFISDAWFAFGRAAQNSVRRLAKGEEVSSAIIEGQGVTANHSSLLISMGDIRIAEWSDNRASRFWSATDRKAPELYKRRYQTSVLLAMTGESGFERLSHNGNWQSKFAGKIFRMTGIRHPNYGSGY